MKYQAYDRYKDSGVPWLGDIPEGWDIVSIKWLSEVKRGASPRPIENPIFFDEDGEYAWVRIADVTASERYLVETTQRLSELGSTLSVKLSSGDLFLSIAGSVGKPMISRIKCCIHDGFVYFPSLKENPEFFYYLFSSGQPYLGLGKMGTQLNLNTDTVGSIQIGLPPPEAQIKIVEFLDERTAEIDGLIGKKEALLKALAEKRTAIITHAVTKGLNPTAKLKPSGVPWLGEIPEGWAVKKLKYIVSYIGSGKTPRGGAEVYSNSGIMIIRSQNVYDDGLRLNDVVYVDEDLEAGQKNTRLNSDDVLLNITGASIARTALVPNDLPPANVNQHVCIFRTNKNKLTSKYLHYHFVSYAGKSQILASETGTSREGLNFQQAGNMVIALPSISAQAEVTSFLDTKMSEIDSIVTSVKDAISKLKEYRTSLITNAVTGKIKVA